MRVSLTHKYIIGLLAIFCVGYTIMSFSINKLVIKNNENIIKKESIILQKDLTTYLKQYFQLKNKDLDIKNFNNNAESIASALSSKTEDRVILHSQDGKFLADSAMQNGQVLVYEDVDKKERQFKSEDIKLATSNKSVFSILPVKDKYIVVFSFPIIEKGKNIGIVRCIRDYSEIFSSSEQLLKLVNTFLLLVIGGIFLFILLLSKKVTIPIIKLSKVSKEVAKGNFSVCLNETSQDEIGDLIVNFNKMKKQISNQIETIKKDRDNLKRLESHRKVFFDNITHEMKTPLTIISGYSQVLINQDFKDKDFLRKSVKKMKDESERMHKMVLELLQISKAESDISSRVIEEFNLSKVIDSACSDMKIRADKYEILLEKHIEEDIFLLGNPNELRRVIVNLIDNSIKYGNNKSTIHIELFKDEDYCSIAIKDKGQGIPPNKLEKIFQPFYRVDKMDSREKGSCGLGLSIVKTIIEKHNGHIDIKSKEGVGTTVYIKIPLKVYNMATSG